MHIYYLVEFTDLKSENMVIDSTDISTILNDGDLTVELRDGTLIHGIDRLSAINVQLGARS